ncbi:MAG: flagellar biosynthetic protein FliO [Limnobacter sp.]|nr:flagellar biosynthetic protein FliO [Limnobacter sp.]
MQSIWSSLAVFVLILAAIPLSAWLLRRSQGLRSGAAALNVHCAVAVGTRERIAIVRADRKWLVVGVTSQSISLLAELDEAPAELPGAWASADAAAATDATSGVRRFADLLRGESRRGPG